MTDPRDSSPDETPDPRDLSDEELGRALVDHAETVRGALRAWMAGRYQGVVFAPEFARWLAAVTEAGGRRLLRRGPGDPPPDGGAPREEPDPR